MQKLNKYGYIPRVKPFHLIRIAMENFNSLCVLSGNEKINELNNICREYTVDILYGCETYHRRGDSIIYLELVPKQEVSLRITLARGCGLTSLEVVQ
jgi:hypothetical protein